MARETIRHLPDIKFDRFFTNRINADLRVRRFDSSQYSFSLYLEDLERGKPIYSREEEVEQCKKLEKARVSYALLQLIDPTHPTLYEFKNIKGSNSLNIERANDQYLEQNSKQINITHIKRKNKFIENYNIKSPQVQEKIKEKLQDNIRTGQIIFNEFLEHNLRLVVSIAKNFQGKTHLADLVQEGNIGLSHALSKFDWRRGNKFSTYATWWIRQSIIRHLDDDLNIIRIPVHTGERIRRYDKVKSRLTNELQREPSLEEIAFAMNLTVDKIKSTMESKVSAISLNKKVRGKNEQNLEDIITNEDSPETESLNTQRAESVESLLQCLTPREIDIIKKRFGIGCEKSWTLEEIGNDISLTRERVRQIEDKAKRKLFVEARRRELDQLL